jgi:preprotein translocase subunit SecF
MELFKDADFDFLGKKWWFILPSLAVIVAGLISTVARGGLLYNIDFKGGTQMELRWDGVPPVHDIRTALSSKLPSVTVVGAHGTSGSNEVIVSTELPAGSELNELRQTVEHALSGIGTHFSILNFETIGPQVSEDLRHHAFIATAGASGGMLMYLSYRFRFAYAVAAVFAMVHDVVITIGLFSLLRQEISLTVVAALLTLIGYSMNDTVVVFDRIRENRRMKARAPLDVVINRSINQTLSRTVLTSGLTLLTAVSLLVFGGPVLHGFSLVLVIGIFVGTFSSVFIASPILLALEQSRLGDKALDLGGLR